MPVITRPWLRCLLWVAFALIVGWGRSAVAGVVVVANRTEQRVAFRVAEADGQAKSHALEPGEIVSIPIAAPGVLTFERDGKSRRHLLDVNSVYYFLTREGKFDLIKVLFSAKAEDPAAPPVAVGGVRIDAVAKIPVMLLVDDEEPAVQAIWEKRLRERLEEASDVFERACRIRFEVVATGTWTSDDRVTDFDASLREFELKVTPTPARLAIGFTSQYSLIAGQTHLGGTRGSLGTHVLIREAARRISKTERLEVLLHELGHFLGAMHSPEGTSVMRPKIGDHRSSAVDFRIGFDPANVLAMNLVCEELRTRPIRSLGDLRPETRATLRDVYSALAKLLPNDPAGEHFLEMLETPSSARSQPTKHASTLAEATAEVVRAIDAAARENRAKPSTTALRGERLTELYVRRAAAAAARLPADRAGNAFLLGLGIALDRSNLLRGNAITSNLCAQVETGRQAADRLAVMGTPTVRGRYDLTQHFAVSGALTALVGQQAAELVGRTKELNDSRQGTGFSFADLAADMAGATFGEHVRSGKLPLTRIATSFRVEDYMPAVEGLPESLSWPEFLEQYGSTQDERFHAQENALRREILLLSGYAAGSAAVRAPTR